MARPVFLILDDFFEDPEGIRTEIIYRDFVDFKNPVDAIIYPGIQVAPKGTQEILEHRLRNIIGRDIVIDACFARLTTKKMAEAPHKIHSDRIMGHYSCHIYLSKFWPLGGGTSFWTHPYEGQRHTFLTNEARIVEDQNDQTKWSRDILVQAEFNRALIHDACLWHCAEPVGGWGEGPEDGRLVLTTFFSEDI